MIDHQLRDALERIFQGALDAAAPDRLVESALAGTLPATEAIPPMIGRAKRIFLFGAGKAAARMTTAAARHCGRKLAQVLAIVPHGWPRDIAARTAAPAVVLEAGHPIPDESSRRAALIALDFVSKPGPGDLLMMVTSGGASALMALPVRELEFEAKIEVNRMLLRAGASIREFNAVRKHLSAIKGGRLAQAACNTQLLNLILSDVSDNDPGTVGSGPAAPDTSTFEDARAVLKRFHLWGNVPESVRGHLDRGAAGLIEETPKPGAAIFANVANVVIGDNETALGGAAARAAKLGFRVERWRRLQGEANDLGRTLASHLAALGKERTCVIAGGEPIVTVSGTGRGGRAQQLALSLAIELDRQGGDIRIAALAAGTDGADGPTDAAGAFAWRGTAAQARAAGFDPEKSRARNDAYPLFAATGDLLKTGPTGTNVNDIFAALVNY